MNEYLMILLRTFCIFIMLMLVIRLLGKREVGELSVFDLAIILIIADIAAMGIDDVKLFFASILCLILLLILQKSFSFILLKLSILRGFVDGSPRVLVYKGQILFQNLKKEAYTIDDLLTQIHQEGILDISEINLAILETSGSLSVFSKKRYPIVYLPVIVSGIIVKDNISLLNLKKEDVIKKISYKNYNVKDIAFYSLSEKDEGSLFLFKKKRDTIK